MFYDACTLTDSTNGEAWCSTTEVYEEGTRHICDCKCFVPILRHYQKRNVCKALKGATRILLREGGLKMKKIVTSF